MSWLYVPESVVSSLAYNSRCPPLEPSVTSKGKPFRQRSWSRAWRRATYLPLLSGLTLPASTLELGVESWISSLRDTRASRSQPPETVEASTTTVGSGLKSLACLRTPSQLSLFSKTSPDMSTTDLTKFGETFEGWASRLRRVCFRRKRSAQTIFGSDSISLLPTPSATPYGSSQNEGGVNHDRPSRGTPSLETLAIKGRLLPTPTARDYKGPTVPNPQGNVGLPNALGQTRRVLSPQFVEWMMGWPLNWTCVCGRCEVIACEQSETVSSPKQRPSPGAHSGNDWRASHRHETT